MSDVTLLWQGIGGHFICAHRCRYSVSTVIFVDNEAKYIVSTVGAMTSLDKEEVYEQIGCDRYYETYVFGDVSHKFELGDTYYTQSGQEIDMDAIDKPYAFGKATDMHQKMVDKWSKIAGDNNE
jgi:hypothetical protein